MIVLKRKKKCPFVAAPPKNRQVDTNSDYGSQVKKHSLYWAGKHTVSVAPAKKDCVHYQRKE